MSPQPGVIHNYSTTDNKLIAFEHHHPSSTTTANGRTNYLLFIGGMGDGLHSVPVVHLVSPRLPAHWTLVEVLTSSSYVGWGTGSLRRDVGEISQAVGYFRRRTEGEGRVVVMGHSTGSQDALQYMLTMADAGDKVERIDAAILQAPVSDRESIMQSTGRTTYLTALTFAESFISSGQGAEVMPLSMRPTFEDTPITAERWYSITAPLNPTTKEPQGVDDFFSSDITPATLSTTFGRIPSDLDILILYSGSDQHVPSHVDKPALVGRWKDACSARWSEHSGIVKGAVHDLKDASEETINDLMTRLTAFLRRIAGESKAEPATATEGATDTEAQKEKKEEEEGTMSIKEAAERAPGYTMEEQDPSTPSQDAKTTEPDINDVTKEEEHKDNAEAEQTHATATATAVKTESATIKPTEVEEAAIKPTEVEESTTNTTTSEASPDEAAPQAAAGDGATETEVKQVEQGGNGAEVEIPLGGGSGGGGGAAAAAEK